MTLEESTTTDLSAVKGRIRATDLLQHSQQQFFRSKLALVVTEPLE